jgi:hypothetical protein
MLESGNYICSLYDRFDCSSEFVKINDRSFCTRNCQVLEEFLLLLDEGFSGGNSRVAFQHVDCNP